MRRPARLSGRQRRGGVLRAATQTGDLQVKSPLVTKGSVAQCVKGGGAIYGRDRLSWRGAAGKSREGGGGNPDRFLHARPDLLLSRPPCFPTLFPQLVFQKHSYEISLESGFFKIYYYKGVWLAFACACGFASREGG